MSRDYPPILASGALVWRKKKGEMQVLIIHRPKYNDWSIPKGKLDRGETFLEGAVREVEEETGIRPALGRPLRMVKYRVGGRAKHVMYWSATVRSRTAAGPVNTREVDQVKWVKPIQALVMLTSTFDRALVKMIVEWDEAGELETSPVIIQRHGAARSREKWKSGDEATRPLKRIGKAQAKALPPLLGAYSPRSAVTSPWKRCLDTIEPFARKSGMDIIHKVELTEHAHAERPARAAAVMERLLENPEPVVVCTHRPVLPTLIDVARAASTEAAAAKLPEKNPYLNPGEMLVLHTTVKGIIVDVERHEPIT